MGESLYGATGPLAQAKSIACPVYGHQRNLRLFPPSCSVELAMEPHGALWEVFLKGSEGNFPSVRREPRPHGPLTPASPGSLTMNTQAGVCEGMGFCPRLHRSLHNQGPLLPTVLKTKSTDGFIHAAC